MKDNSHTIFKRIKYGFFRMTGWLSDQISDRNYQIIASIIIGIVAGLVAVLLKKMVHWLRDLIYGQDPASERFYFVFFPLLGITLTVIFVRVVLGTRLDPGLSGLIFRISRKKINLPPSETYAHVVGSSLTVGFGGSVGLEAPIIRTGSAIGSNLARLLRVGRNRHTLFLACGAAAGMAAIFNSPVAGVIFAFEVLITDIALSSFIPLLISAATGALIAKTIYYEQILFLPSGDWDIAGIPFYILLGLICGFLSVYMIRTVIRIDHFFDRYDRSWLKILLGGLALGVLVFLMPPLFGEGYKTVNDILSRNFVNLLDHSPFYRVFDTDILLLVFGLMLVLAKAVAAAITIATGGNGGVFAPAMFSGALLGFVFSHGINQMGFANLNEANFAAVAMAGLLSGVFKSPLTGIFLIAEITGGYELFVPLMIVSALSYFVTYYFEPQSIFTKELFQKGLWVPTHERDRNILSDMSVRGLLETNFFPIRPDMTLGSFVQIIAQSRRNIFPVTDEVGMLKGIVLLDDVREIMFQQEKYNEIKVKDIMHNPPAIVDVTDSMEEAMKKFDAHGAWNLPVVDNGRYVGFVSKSSLFNRYRQLLIERSRQV